MARTYRHLGVYSDLVPVAVKANKLFPKAKPGRRTRKQFLDVLNFNPAAKLKSVRSEGRWEKDGVAGEAVSWSVGYGPRTQAWLLRPAGVKGRLPGVLALHDHGGFKVAGKEKVADGPEPTQQVIQDFRNVAYGGVGWANDLARRGFAVLVHDVFLWGSRNIPLEQMPGYVQEVGRRLTNDGFDPGTIQPRDVTLYNLSAMEHEHIIEKYLNLLGTTLAGVVSYEDRLAAAWFASRRDVLPGGVGCVGLSGGGMRAGLLQATSDHIKASVVVGAMSTSHDLLNEHVVCHTWLFLPSQWTRYGDYSDAVACRAPSPLMVQYDIDDPLYSIEGQKNADKRLAAHYKSVGKLGNYVGRFYPGKHKFDPPMQQDAFEFLAKHLKKK